MSIAQQINEDIKSAMKAKEREKLESLRAVKAAILLAASEKGASIEVSDETVLKIVQKLLFLNIGKVLLILIPLQLI